MKQVGPLLSTLLSFMSSRQEITGWLELDPDARTTQVTRLPALAMFEWWRLRGKSATAVLGICASAAGIPHAALKKAGFEPESMLIHSLVVRLADADLYVIAELLSARRIAISLCAFCMPAEWYVLEEHILERET